jgi:hypothetical protein
MYGSVSGYFSTLVIMTVASSNNSVGPSWSSPVLDLASVSQTIVSTSSSVTARRGPLWPNDPPHKATREAPSREQRPWAYVNA